MGHLNTDPRRSSARLVAALVLGALTITLACGRDGPDVPVSPSSDAAAVPTTSTAIGAAADDIVTFTNVAMETLKTQFEVWNDRPGVAVFDYDRDGDLDFYVTVMAGHANRLFQNRGDGTVTDVGIQAGVAAMDSNSTGAVACDLDNDGFQDLYVGAWGDPKDNLDFRSPSQGQGNRDNLFLNMGDGTFTDVTRSAFGDEVNIRSATTVACADVDGDGWLDLYVGNLGDDDFRPFTSPNHPGHYNVLYMNNGDLTFYDVAREAGVRGPQIIMRDSNGQPILFEDPETGEMFEGYDPTTKDKLGNRVGEPTGQTHSVLFFDYDADGDPDLWVANDGNGIHVYRNDSTSGAVRFTPVWNEMGIEQVGSWMGFAVGDYDGDADLDVFVTNIGFHTRVRPINPNPSGSCETQDRFPWGTCLHYLLRNDGTKEVPGVGTVGVFRDVAPQTEVIPSPIMPPDSLDPSNIHPTKEVPTGLAAYDFGFGTTFFDYDNDGDQDLYWLGSLDRGGGPGGQIYPSAGRMLRGDGRGSFEDVTVRSRLLDIVGVDYSERAPDDFRDPPAARRMEARHHENGKGVAHGDLDGDGYVDLVATNASGPLWDGSLETITPARGPIFVWISDGGDNHWLTLRLKGRMAIDGTGSNADGIGARVVLKSVVEGRSEPLVQVQEVRAGSSYLSMDSVDLEFGLGAATVVDELSVRWPSGRVQSLANVPVDQVLTVVEPLE